MTVERARRGAVWALGVLWLLDGALQLQPYMFGTGFAKGIVAPAGQGQPGPVAASVSWAAHLILTAPAVWDALFAVVQLGIGVLLLLRRTARIGLAVSIVWSAGVWWFGEGAGGVTNGGVSLLTGAPGAVLLYALIALCVWPATEASAAPWARRLAAVLPLRASAVRALWLAVWASDALLRLLSAHRSGTALHDALAGGASAAPSWLVGFDHTVAAAAGHAGSGAAIGVAVLELAIGLSAFAGPWMRRVGLGAGVLVSLFVWVVGEDFGQLYTGQATDPNSGPLLVLLAVVVGVAASRPASWNAVPRPEASGSRVTANGRTVVPGVGRVGWPVRSAERRP